MKCARSVSNFTFFACGCLIVTTPFVEKILLSPLNFLCSFVKDKLTTCVWVYFWALFCSTGLFYILSLVSHQVASVLPISFFFNIVLTMLGLLASWISNSHDQPRQHIKRRKAVTNLDSILKRDITLLTKIRVVRAMVFPVVMYGCESWTTKKTECWRIDAFELWCQRRLLRVPWTTRRSN